MKIFTVIASHVVSGEYVGDTDLSNWDGHIEIAADLGIVKFKTPLRAMGHIIVRAGSGIKASGGPKTGDGIIKGGGGIAVGWRVEWNPPDDGEFVSTLDSRWKERLPRSRK